MLERFQMKLPAGELSALRAKAREDGVSVGELIRRAVAAYLERLPLDQERVVDELYRRTKKKLRS